MARKSAFWKLQLSPMSSEQCPIRVTQGVATREDIDKTMKLGMNHPMGPLELADL